MYSGDQDGQKTREEPGHQVTTFVVAHQRHSNPPAVNAASAAPALAGFHDLPSLLNAGTDPAFDVDETPLWIQGDVDVTLIDEDTPLDSGCNNPAPSPLAASHEMAADDNDPLAAEFDPAGLNWNPNIGYLGNMTSGYSPHGPTSSWPKHQTDDAYDCAIFSPLAASPVAPSEDDLPVYKEKKIYRGNISLTRIGHENPYATIRWEPEKELDPSDAYHVTLTLSSSELCVVMKEAERTRNTLDKTLPSLTTRKDKGTARSGIHRQQRLKDLASGAVLSRRKTQLRNELAEFLIEHAALNCGVDLSAKPTSGPSYRVDCLVPWENRTNDQRNQDRKNVVEQYLIKKNEDVEVSRTFLVEVLDQIATFYQKSAKKSYSVRRMQQTVAETLQASALGKDQFRDACNKAEQLLKTIPDEEPNLGTTTPLQQHCQFFYQAFCEQRQKSCRLTSNDEEQRYIDEKLAAYQQAKALGFQPSQLWKRNDYCAKNERSYLIQPPPRPHSYLCAFRWQPLVGSKGQIPKSPTDISYVKRQLKQLESYVKQIVKKSKRAVIEKNCARKSANLLILFSLYREYSALYKPVSDLFKSADINLRIPAGSQERCYADCGNTEPACGKVNERSKREWARKQANNERAKAETNRLRVYIEHLLKFRLGAAVIYRRLQNRLCETPVKTFRTFLRRMCLSATEDEFEDVKRQIMDEIDSFPELDEQSPATYYSPSFEEFLKPDINKGLRYYNADANEQNEYVAELLALYKKNPDQDLLAYSTNPTALADLPISCMPSSCSFSYTCDSTASTTSIADSPCQLDNSSDFDPDLDWNSDCYLNQASCSTDPDCNLPLNEETAAPAAPTPAPLAPMLRKHAHDAGFFSPPSPKAPRVAAEPAADHAQAYKLNPQ